MDDVPLSADDAGLFQHDPEGGYLHLLREVLLTYRCLMREATIEFGLPAAQLEVLRQLALAGGRATTSALARALAIDAAAVTRVVGALERLALVSRERDEHDGRRRPVRLTSAGRALVVGFHARVHARESELAAQVDPESVAAAMRVLRAIRDAVAGGEAHRQARVGSGGACE